MTQTDQKAGQEMKTVSASVPASLKAEVSAILDSRGISMTAFLRDFLGRVAANDKKTLAWIKEARD